MKLLTFLLILLAGAWGSTPAEAQMGPRTLTALGAPDQPRIPMSWNRYHNTDFFGETMQRMARTFPNLAAYSSIGKSYEGRDLHLLTITNSATGDPRSKPGMFITGNIHGNEIQAGEVSLYTAWYLLENYDRVQWIRELVDARTFYILPIQNPDSRDRYIAEANNANSPRTGQVPVDNDGDGLADEDCPNDLNGDGHITQMRRRVPGGRWKEHQDDPRIMIQCSADEACEWEVYMTEGYDVDGDGQINEDCGGGYDPNRNWGWLWEPNYIQGGSHHYPFSLPETRAVKDFVRAHPNIMGIQAYHNTGGMILQGPGVAEDRIYPADTQVFSSLGRRGEQMLPGYRSLVTHKDLYTVYGGETDFYYASLGMMPYVNELWTAENLFRRRSEGGWFGSMRDYYRFDELLLFGEGIVPWTPVDHPQLGPIEVGGMKKQMRRMPPSFLLEEEAHRNMAFTLWHAYELPQVAIENVRTRSLAGGLTEVSATLRNHRMVPTRLAVDVQNNINRPDWVSLEGLEVRASGIRTNPFTTDFDAQPSRPARIDVPAIPGHGAVEVVWVVQGSGAFTIALDSQKGGRATHRHTGR